MYSGESAPTVPSIDILLVEDNAGDIFLIRNALAGWSTQCNLYTVVDGEEAIRFLRQKGEYANSPQPQLILLDLNLPKKDGREVLAEIKTDPKLKHIPIIVMTASASEQDILRSYQLYANCYITKPSDLNRYTETLQAIESFWFTCAQLPATT